MNRLIVVTLRFKAEQGLIITSFVSYVFYTLYFVTGVNNSSTTFSSVLVISGNRKILQSFILWLCSISISRSCKCHSILVSYTNRKRESGRLETSNYTVFGHMVFISSSLTQLCIYVLQVSHYLCIFYSSICIQWRRQFCSHHSSEQNSQLKQVLTYIFSPVFSYIHIIGPDKRVFINFFVSQCFPQLQTSHSRNCANSIEYLHDNLQFT